MTHPTITLKQYRPGGVTEGDGDAIDIEIDGFGPVTIEHWDAGPTSGFDCYRETTPKMLDYCCPAVAAHIGEAAHEQLHEGFFDRIVNAYNAVLTDHDFEGILAKALERAREVQFAVPSEPCS